MGVKTATFSSAGRISQHEIPGAYSRVGSAKSRAGLVSTSNCVILGTAFGGEPGMIHWLSDGDDGIALLQNQGNLMECVREFFNPGHDLTPSKLGVYRINTAVQASAILTSAVTVNDEITIKTKDYGILFNQTEYKVTAGTTGKRFYERYKGVENDIDNITRPSLQIQYTGAGTPAVMTITVTNSVATTLATTITGGPGGQDLSITLSNYPTIEALVAYINAQTDYTCTALTANGASELSADLDAEAAVNILVAFDANSDIQAMIDAINDLSLYFTATVIATSGRVTDIDNIAWIYVTGGSEGSATSSEWTAALVDIADEDVQLVGVAIEDDATNVLVATHLGLTNNETGKSERQAILPAAAATIATAITEAAGKNTSPMCLAYAKYKQYNVNNVLSTFGSMEYAAKLLGQAVALDLNEPMTNKSLNMVSLTDKPTVAQQKAAVLAGLILPAKKNGAIRTVRTVTTSKLEDIKYVEFSILRQMLFMSRDLRTGAEELYVGKAGTAGAVIDLDSYCRDKFVTYEDELHYLISDPADPLGNPGWHSLVLTVGADQVRIGWKGNVVAPFNFIFITNLFDVLVQAA